MGHAQGFTIGLPGGYDQVGLPHSSTPGERLVPTQETPHWTYHQATGLLVSPEGTPFGHGYSGHGEGLNNPSMDHVQGVGPIPRGWYSIGPAHTSPHTGPVTMDLDPLPGTEMHGRSLIRLHGDNSAANHTASDGCVIEDHTIRLQVAASSVKLLEVV